MITGGRIGIQRCLTCASDLTIKIEVKEAETETEREMEAKRTAMGDTEGIYWEEYIAPELKGIDQVLTRPGSIRGHKSRLSQ